MRVRVFSLAGVDDLVEGRDDGETAARAQDHERHQVQPQLTADRHVATDTHTRTHAHTEMHLVKTHP